MKARPLHEEGLGTAAVDLFASGMGAFILIALLFIVLLTVRSGSEDFGGAVDQVAGSGALCPAPSVEEASCPPPTVCPEVAETAACPEPLVIYECPEDSQPAMVQGECAATIVTPKCPACPAVPAEKNSLPATSINGSAAGTASASQGERVATAGALADGTLKILPDFDLVLVLDSTSSMEQEIEALKRNLYILVEVLEEIMPSVGIGVVTFNDRQQKPAVQQHPIRRITGDNEAMVRLQRFLRGIRAGDAKGPNDDTPEAVLQALRVAVASDFRPDVRNRSIIVITDAYAYDDEVDEAWRLAESFSSVPGQRISTVHVDADKEAEEFLLTLSEYGKGSFVPDRGSILANVLLTVL